MTSKESDPSSPILNPERSSKVIGGGQRVDPKYNFKYIGDYYVHKMPHEQKKLVNWFWSPNRDRIRNGFWCF